MNIGFLAIMLGLLVGICAYCWFKGRPAEKYGAAIYFVGFWVALAVQMTQDIDKSVVLVLISDTLTALGFLILAFRYNSLWLGAVMVFQGLILGLHTTHLTDLSDSKFMGFNLYALSMNLVGLVMVLTLGFAAMLSARERKRANNLHGAAQGSPA